MLVKQRDHDCVEKEDFHLMDLKDLVLIQLSLPNKVLDEHKRVQQPGLWLLLESFYMIKSVTNLLMLRARFLTSILILMSLISLLDLFLP